MTNSESAVTFGDWGKIAVEQHFKKILKHEAAVLKDKDPEELHQMRVGIRRLRSAMIGFAPAIALPKTATEKNVGNIGKILGELRDLDVLKLTIEKEYLPNLPNSEQKYLAQAVQVITKKRKKAFKKVKSTLEKKSYQHFKQDLKEWLEKPEYTNIAATKIDLILPDLLLPQTSKLLLHPGWLVGVDLVAGEINLNSELSLEQVTNLLEQEEEMLHGLRKEAKKNRYNMALFTNFYSEQYFGYLQKIKDLQEILGVIQDCFVLKSFFTNNFKVDLEKKLPILIQKFNQQRYQKWQEWQSLQQQFLDLTTRKEFQKTIIS
ncbi:MAG: CHAD domain-containing protein [Waterburya sp.]